MNEQEQNPHCATCKFSVLTSQDRRCHRYPPQVSFDESGREQWGAWFPRVAWNDWCGEYIQLTVKK
jgi:hypothetical protein